MQFFAAGICFMLLLPAATSGQNIMVSCDATRVIFVGVENPVSVMHDKYKLSDITVQVSTGSIEPAKLPGSYSWKVCEKLDSVAYLKMIYRGKIIDSFRFTLMTIRDPVAMIGRGYSRFGLNQLKASQGVRADLNDFYIEGIRCEVLRFDVYRTRKDTYLAANNTGAYFTGDAKAIVADAQPGDTFVFDNIWVQVGCEPRPRRLQAVVFNIY